MFVLLSSLLYLRINEMVYCLVFSPQDYLKSQENFNIRHIFVGGKLQQSDDWLSVTVNRCTFHYNNNDSCSAKSRAEYEMKKEKKLEKHFNEIHFPLGSQ